MLLPPIMNFLFLLGVVVWCTSSVVSAEVDLDFVGAPSINDIVVQHHLRSRSEMITQEMGQRQGASKWTIYGLSGPNT